MKKLYVTSLLLLFLFSCQNFKTGVIRNLKSGYLENPLTISEDYLTFSWQMVSEENNLMQTAYKVKVWTNKSTVWNSGKISSDESVGIKYEGKKIEPFTRYLWQVWVWDNKGNGHVSEIAFFETGPLHASHWNAQWIGKPVEKPKKFLYKPENTYWIWFPEADVEKDNPKGIRYFKTTFAVKDIQKVEAAGLLLTGDDACELNINGNPALKAGHLKIRHADVKALIKAGQNIIEMKAENKWGEAGVFAQLYLKYNDGNIEYISTDKGWLSSRDKKNWMESFVIGEYGKVENFNWLNEKSMIAEELLAPTYLRKDFNAAKKIANARLYASAFGLYQIFINGQKAHQNYFAPGWTDYSKRVLYQSYDVTSLVQTGENAIAAILADGWYAGTIGWGHKRNNYGTYPLWLLAELHIQYEDGTEIVIATDSSWKYTTGPITASDFLDGERYDARLEMPGWEKYGFDDAKWNTVVSRNVSETINPDNGPMIVITDTINPIDVKTLNNNACIFDMGQNMVGIVQIMTQGKKGDSLVLRFAEMLNTDGSIYTNNLRSAKATDTYIFKGEGTETYTPSFTFHGFRYVEVTGLQTQPEKNMIKGLFIQSQTPRTGYFECSDTLVNKIYHNAFWGQKSNYLSVPTDCPQRDERLGWMGDALVFTPAACFNMDIASFMNKWMVDVEDAQASNGGYSNVSPRLIAAANGAPAWADAGLFVPWAVYQHYNNKTVLEKHYQSFVRYINYLHEANPDLIWKNKRGPDYGDWLSTNANTDKEVLATAFFARSTAILSEIAGVLNNKEDEKKYKALFENIRAAFVKEYVDNEGRIRGNTQTPYVLALAFNLLADDVMKKKAAAHLVENIKERDWHHSTGFIGIGNLMQVLTENGYPDVAYKLMTNKTFPSLGYMVVNGATTIWERWDGWTTEKGFQSSGMNSFNHYSLGSPARWLYTHAAGINAGTPGFKTIIIKPYICSEFSFVNAAVESVYGKIYSQWNKQDDGNYQLLISIPANTRAKLFVPGEIIKGVEEIKDNRKENGFTVFEAGSGEYEFILSLKE